MKVNSLFILSTALLFAGCVNEIVSNEQNGQEPQVNLVPVTFQAGSEEDSESDTKVTLGVDKKSVLWTETDKIKVFDKISNGLDAFTVSSGAGTTLAAISGSVSAGATGNFYAMYPYQADATFTSETTLGDNTVKDGYITLEVPAKQKAVAGSLDPAAFIGVGQCTDGTRFNFKNSTAFVKFQLNSADVEGLETVSFSGNSLGSVAGKIKIGFTESGSVAQTYVSGAGAQYITLSKPEGGWESGVDYYFAIRPLKFADGFTITARYTDNSCRHLTTTKGVTDDSGAAVTVSRNCTMNLGTLPGMKAGLPNDLYIAYLHGQDINIAGKIVNKTKYSDATLVTAAKTISGTTGVFFINNDINVTIAQNEMNQAAFIGRYNNKRSAVTVTKQIQPKSSGSDETIIIKNLDINYTPIAQFFVLKSDFANLAIDNCAIKYLQHTLIHAATYECANVSIENSEIGFTMNTAKSATEASTPLRTAMYLLYADQNTENTNTTSINFNNNIVYYKSTELLKNPKDFKIVHGKTKIDKISVDKNTFINTSIPNAGLIRFTTLTNSCKVTSNIFEECNISGVKSWILQNASVIASGDISNNHYYTSTTDGTLGIISTASNIENITTKDEPVKSENSLLNGWDFENGIFGTYNLPDGVTGVGATR